MIGEWVSEGCLAILRYSSGWSTRCLSVLLDNLQYCVRWTCGALRMSEVNATQVNGKRFRSGAGATCEGVRHGVQLHNSQADKQTIMIARRPIAFDFNYVCLALKIIVQTSRPLAHCLQ